TITDDLYQTKQLLLECLHQKDYYSTKKLLRIYKVSKKIVLETIYRIKQILYSRDLSREEDYNKEDEDEELELL
ncbi:MAG: hypothetical protein QXI16_05980, partial [Sulfolobaceae archaeon]